MTSTTSAIVGNKIHLVVRTIFVVVGSVEVITGVAGNLLLLTVLLTRRSLGRRDLHILFLANLAVADLLTQGYWTPFLVLDLIFNYHPVESATHCVANGFIICMFLAVTVLSLVLISLNRYLHVCHTRTYNRVFTKRRITLCCAASWVAGAVLACPPLVGVGSYDYNAQSHTCSYVRNETNLYLKLLYILFCVVPMIFVGYWNYAIFDYWKTSRLSLRHKYPLIQKTKTGRGTRRNRAGSKKDEGRTEQNSSSIEDPSQELAERSDGREHSRNSTCGETLGQNPRCDQGACESNPEAPTMPQDNTDPLLQDGPLETLNRRRRKERAREEAFVRSLYVVFLLMLASFAPYAIVIIVTWSVGPLPPEVVIASILLLLFNCSVNWIVYGVMNRSFRRGYVKHVKRVLGTCCRRPCPRLLGDNLNETVSANRIFQGHSSAMDTDLELSVVSHDHMSSQF